MGLVRGFMMLRLLVCYCWGCLCLLMWVGGLLCCVVCWWVLFYCAFDVGFVVMCLLRLFWLTLFCGVLLYGCLVRCFLLVCLGEIVYSV